MAARLNLRQQEQTRSAFYVYRIFDGFETVYVGKGSGRRLDAQKRKFRLDGEIIEECKSDDHAFEREVHWIAELKPTENILAGGNGGRCKRRRKARSFPEMTRQYAAKFLLTRLDERNCEGLGVPLANLARLAEVAAGTMA